MAVTARPNHYKVVRTVARFSPLRESIAAAVGFHARTTAKTFEAEQRAALNDSFFDSDAIDRFSHDLRADGYALGLNLPGQLLDQLLEYTSDNPCYADRNPALGFVPTHRADAESILGKPILLAEYFNARANCAAINAIIRDPLVQLVAARHLGKIPRVVGTSLWWTFPVKASREDRLHHAHFFHRDVDDFRFVKFFFYLTDVRKGDGGHVIVRNSHREPPTVRVSDRVLLRRFDDEEIERFYGPERISEITGPAGTGFAENTLCVHKGLTPVANPRLILQVEFAFYDYGLSHDSRTLDQLKSITEAEDHS
jgi:hypothetical protein